MREAARERERGLRWGETDTFIYLFSWFCVTLFTVKHFAFAKNRRSRNLPYYSQNVIVPTSLKDSFTFLFFVNALI